MAKTELEKALEHYKVDSGETSSDIAEALGVTRATLWSKARGDTPINIKQAKTLADKMGISLEEFYKLVPRSD
jgi:transcriptional regulator with XRE-family HTH domain